MLVAIAVEKLGKAYRIGQEHQRFRYRTLRESLVSRPLAGIRRLRNGRGRGRTEEFWALKDVDLEVRPGETLRVELGGTGRPIVGRLTRPRGLDAEVDWTYGSYSFGNQPRQPEPPAGLSDEDTRRWWRESEPAKAYRRAGRHFPLVVGPDGSFRVEDVPAGRYVLKIPFEGLSRSSREGRQAFAHCEVAVPEVPGGRSDEPLDVGAIPLEVVIELILTAARAHSSAVQCATARS